MHDTSKVMTNVLEKFTILLLSLKNVHLRERERREVFLTHWNKRFPTDQHPLTEIFSSCPWLIEHTSLQ